MTNLEYEYNRNKLIPKAMQIAQGKVDKLKHKTESRPDGKDGFYTHCLRSEFFHVAMGN